MTTRHRALSTQGTGDSAVHELVTRALATRLPDGGVLVDVGCGAGDLCAQLVRQGRSHRHIGVDVVHHEQSHPSVEFVQCDLDAESVPLPDAIGDAVCCVETIEHLENPRAAVRELVRLAKPGALVLVTTPNQLSLLSKLSLVLRNNFDAFDERQGQYPAHITALLEGDLVHIFRECGLRDVEIRYSYRGRIPKTNLHWPRTPLFDGRAFSDNVLCRGEKPPG